MGFIYRIDIGLYIYKSHHCFFPIFFYDTRVLSNDSVDGWILWTMAFLSRPGHRGLASVCWCRQDPFSATGGLHSHMGHGGTPIAGWFGFWNIPFLETSVFRWSLGPLGSFEVSRFQWLLQQRPGCMANAFLHPRGNAEGHGGHGKLESGIWFCWMDRLVG